MARFDGSYRETFHHSLPRIAFCTTCKGRVQHLKQTLPKNLADTAGYPNAVFVILDYGSPDDLAEWVQREYAGDRRVRLYRYDAGPFRMAHAKNMAHRLGIEESADVLVNMDADNFTGPGFAWWLADTFRANPKHAFMWSRMVQRCNADTQGGVCLLPRDHEGTHSASQLVLEERYPNENDRPLVRGISGRIAITADAFLKVGGYDEKYSAWGPDDRDMNNRLQLLGYKPIEIPSRYLQAIHHSEKLRFREYPHAQPAGDSAEQPIDPNPHTAVVNFGNFGCGEVYEQTSS